MGYKLLIILIDTMQHLIEGEATHLSDGIHVFRVMWIQADDCAGILVTSAAIAPGDVGDKPGGGVVGVRTIRTGSEVQGCRTGRELVEGGHGGELVRVDNATIVVTGPILTVIFNRIK